MNGNEERPFPQELINELDEMEQTDEELQEEARRRRYARRAPDMRGKPRPPANELTQHAAATELTALVVLWEQAEENTKHATRRAIDDGVPFAILTPILEMSRSTIYRWTRREKR